ncbi:MAG: DUF2811 domain-containing protein [Oscillatoriales cyanobacterium]|jgi:Protein of unknown function (DUF2811)|nr:MAG: DUF2811 domain-containing protein [Oscillatoriales cyanobacterium]
MGTNVSILAEIPEDLHLSMQGYLNGNPDWDQDRVFSAAISLFLLQNTVENTPEASLNYRRAARVYLETLFRDKPEVSPAGVDGLTEFDRPITTAIEPETIADKPPSHGPQLTVDEVSPIQDSPLNPTTSALDSPHHLDVDAA